MVSERQGFGIAHVSGAAEAIEESPKKRSGFALLLCLLVLTALCIWGLKPPRAVSAAAPAMEFSSERAMNHVKVIAQSPHPLGSPEHKRVREYILKELSAQGLSPEIQKQTMRRIQTPPAFYAVTVQNILARLKGQDSSHALMLLAHYDSVPNSPGASDDAAGVAALLETLRALKAGPPLKNDVIFLFTDGEEISLVGARAFLQHPWSKEVAVAFNFEARGSGGPVMMYETSIPNGRLIKEFASSAQYPVATSYMADIYRMMPNDTDLSFLMRDTEIAGLNFAYISSSAQFHTAGDSLKNIDERSLQHDGSYALDLVRKFGNMDLNQLPRVHTDGTVPTEVVYFDLFGLFLVRYPSSLVILISIILVGLFGTVVWLGLKKKFLTVRGMLFGLAALLASLVCAVVISEVSTEVVSFISPAFNSGGPGRVPVFVGLLTLSLAGVGAVYKWFAARTSVYNLTVGGLFIWLLLALATTFFFKGASYLFAWPLGFSLAAQAMVFTLSKERLDSPGPYALFLLCAAPGVIVILPAILSMNMGLGLDVADELVILLTLLVASLITHLSILATSVRRQWLAIGCAVCLALILFGLGIGFDKTGELLPKPTSLFYGLDADTGQAVWASSEGAPDKWTSQVMVSDVKRAGLTNYFPLMTQNLLNSPAPVSPLKPPLITRVSDTQADGVRKLGLRLTTLRDAQMLEVATDEDSKIDVVWVNGIRTELPGKRILMRYYGVPEEGINLVLEVSSNKPVSLRVADYTNGLAQSTGLSIQERPADLRPSLRDSWLQETAAVSKSYVF